MPLGEGRFVGDGTARGTNDDQPPVPPGAPLWRTPTSGIAFGGGKSTVASYFLTEKPRYQPQARPAFCCFSQPRSGAKYSSSALASACLRPVSAA